MFTNAQLLRALCVSACVLAPAAAHAQSAYFSFTGDFNTETDSAVFSFSVGRSIGSGETIGAATFASSGGTNAAGDVIPNGPGDSLLAIFNSSGQVIAADDDTNGFDAVVSMTQGDDPLPSPLPSGNYNLLLLDFDGDANPFAVDLVGPADTFRLNLFSADGEATTFSSLKIGTQGAGSQFAIFSNTTANALTIDGPLVVGQSGNARFDQTVGGSTRVNGTTTVNPGDFLNIQSGAFDANGDITVNGGTLVVNNTGQNLLAFGKDLLVTNGGQVRTTSGISAIDGSQTATISSGAAWLHVGTLVAGSINGNGTITVDGAGSILNVTEDLDLTDGGNRGVVNVQNNALATPGQLRIGRSFTNATTDGELNINTGGDLTTGDVRVGDLNGNQGTGTINLDGTGSTLTQTGASSLVLGNFDTPNNGSVHAINVSNGAVYTTGTGTTTIRNTGTLNLNSGGTFDANGDVNVDGGTLSRNGGSFDLARDGTLAAENGGQINFTGDYTLGNNSTLAVTDGGAFTLTSNLGIAGESTLTVDGPGSRVNLNTSNSADSFWGTNAGSATVTVSNQGALTLGNSDTLRLSTSISPVNNATLDVTSGGTVSLNTLEVAALSNGSATVTVTGAGSSLTQSTNSGLSVGSSDPLATGVGRIVVSDGGTLSTGAGGIDIFDSGSLRADATSEVNINGNVFVNGGLFSVGNAGQTLVGSGKDLLASNGGQVWTTSSSLFFFADQTATINSGAGWIHTGRLTAGALNSDGTITLDGTGSTLNVTENLELTNDGNRGVLNVQNDAQATVGELDLGRGNTNTNTDAELNINTGGDLSTGGVFVGEIDGNQGTGTINLNGSGSSLTQTGSSILDLGNADTLGNGGVHAVNVIDSAVYTTGTGTTTIRNTGTLNVSSGGAFNANGNINVIGGTLNQSGGAINFSPGVTLTASENATLAVAGFAIDNGVTLNVTDGSDLITSAGLATIGPTGTLNVNTGGTFNASNSQLLIDGGTLNDENGSVSYDNLLLAIADGGSVTGNLTFLAQSSGSFTTATVTGTGSSLTAAGSGLRVGERGSAILEVRDGATLSSANATLGTNPGAAGTVNVTDNGSSWTNSGPLFVGGNFSVAGGAGTLNVDNRGSVTSEGNVTIYAPGTLDVGATGTFNADGDFSNAGTLALEVDPEGSATVRVGGTATLGGTLSLAGGDELSLYRSQAILFAGGRAGTFDTVEGHLLGDNTALAVTYDADSVNVTRARVGDANLDGDVDVFQFNGGGDAQILTSNLGTTSGATFSDADFNGDGDVDVFQFNGGGDAQLLTSNLGFTSAANASSLVAASTLGLSLSLSLSLEEADAAAGTATGTYDPSTGQVVLDIGAGIGVVGLESLSGERLVPGNLSDALAAAQATATTIAFFNTAGLEPGTFDLGAIVTPGTAVADLGFAFTPIGGDSITTALTVVPEPASLALLGLGGISLLHRRRTA